MASSAATPAEGLAVLDPALSAHCARCGAAFQCGVDEPGGCWCARLPAAAMEADTGCLCPACLDLLLRTAPASKPQIR
jgi:hypothetical protein